MSFDEIFVTDRIENCQNDNFRYRRWRYLVKMTFSFQWKHLTWSIAYGLAALDDTRAVYLWRKSRRLACSAGSVNASTENGKAPIFQVRLKYWPPIANLGVTIALTRPLWHEIRLYLSGLLCVHLTKSYTNKIHSCVSHIDSIHEMFFNVILPTISGIYFLNTHLRTGPIQWRHSARDGVSLASCVCLTVCSGADQGKQQSSAPLAFVRGLTGNSRHKGPVTRKMFAFDDVIMEYAGGTGSVPW